MNKSKNTKQVKHLLSKINLAQQYLAVKLYVTVQTPTKEMIVDALTKPKEPHSYSTIKANRLGVYNFPSCQA